MTLNQGFKFGVMVLAQCMHYLKESGVTCFETEMTCQRPMTFSNLPPNYHEQNPRNRSRHY